MFYPSILYIKIIFTTHENNILSQIPANIQTPNSMAVATNQPTNNHRYNHLQHINRHKLHPQSPNPPTNSKSKNLNKKKKKKTNQPKK